MAKRTKRKKLIDKLDGVCREIVRQKTNNLCQKCGKYVTGSNSHPAHIIPKGGGASFLRFDLKNILHLCFHCHRKWHDDPVDSMIWFKDKFFDRWDYLHKETKTQQGDIRMRKYVVWKFSDSDLAEMFERLKQEISNG